MANGNNDSGRTAGKAARIVRAALTGRTAALTAELLKDVRETGKVLAFALFFLAFLIFTVVWCVPATIYEGLQGFLSNLRLQAAQLKEAWLSGLYAGGGNFLNRLSRALAGTAEELGADLRSLFATGTAGEVYSQADLGVVRNIPDLKEVYTRKITAAREKLTARADEIYTAILSSGILQQALRTRFEREYLTESNRAAYDGIVYDPPEFANISASLSGRDAIRLMSLYSVMKQGSEDAFALSGFMKWLGWKGSGGRRTWFYVADTGIPVTLDAWEGEFLPMYLEEERLRTGGDYSDFMCSAADLLLQVDMPKITSAFAYTYVETEEIYPEPEEELIVTEDLAQVPPPEPVIRRILHVTYQYSIRIQVRNIQEIADMAGLWSGSLDPVINGILRGTAYGQTA